MTEEEKLINSIKNKQSKALEKVVDIYTPYVGTVIYNVVGDKMTREDMEEAIADTFITLWRNADKFDAQKGCLRTYIGTIARNLAKNKLRANKTINCHENFELFEEDIYFKIEKNEERKMLIEAINALGEPDSEIFIRYYYYNERLAYIAKVIGIKINTAKTKLSRGRNKLKKTLGKENEKCEKNQM